MMQSDSDYAGGWERCQKADRWPTGELTGTGNSWYPACPFSRHFLVLVHVSWARPRGRRSA